MNTGFSNKRCPDSTPLMRLTSGSNRGNNRLPQGHAQKENIRNGNWID
jgi:hypothetical protein